MRIAPNEPRSAARQARSSEASPADEPTEEPPRPSEQASARHPIGIKIPVPDAAGGALVILEDRRIERQPNERGAKQDDRDQTQTAMRDPLKKPKESKTFQCPAERDPFALELERKNQTNEKQQRPTLPGEPGVAARGIGSIKFQQRDRPRSRPGQ